MTGKVLTLAVILTLGFTAALFAYAPQQARAEALSSWTPTTALPVATNAVVCVTSGGYVYCLQGVSQSVYYAPLSSSGIGSWTKTTNYPVSISAESCVASGGYIYCVSGYVGPGTMPTGAVYYAPLSSSGVGTWSKTTSYPTPVLGLSCAASTNYIYCVGGDQTIGTLEDNMVYYAPISSSGVGTWSAATNYPVTITDTSCTISGGYIYCVAGFTALGPQSVNTVYSAPISPSGVGAWTSTTGYPTPVDAQSCVLSTGYFYCVGGVANGNPTNAVYYSPVSAGVVGTWTVTTSYPGTVDSQSCVTSSAYIYCIAGNINGAESNSAYYTSVTLSSSSVQLTVNSQNTNGQTISGYYSVLYDQSGNIVATGFTPSSFMLNSGQQYTIQVDGYGSCQFDHWADTGSTSASRQISITANTQLTAVYNCGSSTSSATVSSVDQNGNSLLGYYTILYSSGGSVLATGFTPHTFATTVGQAYSVQVDNYGSCSFVHWSDGVASNPRPFTATGGALALTAVYFCGTGSQSSVVINSVDQNGNTISGYEVVLYDASGAIVGSGFTTATFTVTSGLSYSVQADGYGSCSFNNWSNGASSNPMSFVATNTAQSFTAVYTCNGQGGGPGTITISDHRIPASYWAPCFATTCTNPQATCNTTCTGPGASMWVVLYDSSGNVVATGFADENGHTFTGLTAGATYYIYPADCDLCHGSTHDVLFNHWDNNVNSTTRPLPVVANGTTVSAWYTCTNGCSGV